MEELLEENGSTNLKRKPQSLMQKKTNEKKFDTKADIKFKNKFTNHMEEQNNKMDQLILQ